MAWPTNSRPGFNFTPIRSIICAVTGPLSTRAALLQLLRQAPGYGSDLIRRFGRAAAGPVRLAPARVYPVLKELQAEGLVKAVRLAPRGRRGGRARIYYDLTPKGLAVSTMDRSTLLALLSPSSVWSASEKDRQRMAERLVEADELSEFGAALAAVPR
jgi:DNA-binding PadR family transcriptional regulator